MILEIVPYRSSWADEFAAIGAVLRAALGSLALRIDHIGSTSVPNLAAKDRIDIQVSVAALDNALMDSFVRAGFTHNPRHLSDHVPPGTSAGDDWAKWMFFPPDGTRPTNIHVRIDGRANQRYALLFRDYLRAHPNVAAAYGLVKTALAERHPDDVDFYYDVKDPVCDIVIGGAHDWAKATSWLPGKSDA